MTAHAVTLRLPSPLFDYFRDRAERTRRSLEAEILDVVATAASDAEALPPDVARTLEDLGLLSDDELWRAARTRLSGEEAAQLEALNSKQQEQGLRSREKKLLGLLVDRYDRAVLLRAESARLLKTRGHDVSVLLAA